MRDSSTGLHNRRYMEESLAREIDRSVRSDLPFRVLVLDLDHFKQVNDALGHVTGDRALVAVADLLAEHVRGGDLACRYGGAEFALVLPECGLDTATQRAEQLRQAVGALSFHGDGALPPPRPTTPTDSAALARPPRSVTASRSRLPSRDDASLDTAGRAGTVHAAGVRNENIRAQD